MRSVSFVATVIAAGLALSAPASAQDANSVSVADRSEFNKRVYLTDPGKVNAYACFTRTYDADHLARLPDQKVRTMTLLVKSDWSDEERRVRHSFHLGLSYKGKRSAFESAGDCNHVKFEEANGEIRLGCSIECDGGGLGIAMGRTDDAVRVSVERVRIWPTGKVGDEDKATEHAAGKDDGLFRLERTALEDCASLIDDKKELAAMRKLPGFKRAGGR